MTIYMKIKVFKGILILHILMHHVHSIPLFFKVVGQVLEAMPDQ